MGFLLWCRCASARAFSSQVLLYLIFLFFYFRFGSRSVTRVAPVSILLDVAAYSSIYTTLEHWSLFYEHLGHANALSTV